MSVIDFDAKTDQSMAGTATATQTFAHVTKGINRFLALGVTCEANTVSSASYGGVAMTIIGPPVSASNNTYICYLANPASGSNTVSVTFGAASVFGEITAISLVGVDQAIPVDANNTKHTVGTIAPSITVSSLIPSSWLLDAITNNFTDAISLSAPQVQRTNLTADARLWGMSTKSVSASGSQSMAWSSGASSDDFDHVVIVVRPATPSFKPNTLRPHAFSPGMAR